MKGLTRRQFLQGVLTALGGLLVSRCQAGTPPSPPTTAPPTPTAVSSPQTTLTPASSTQPEPSATPEAAPPTSAPAPPSPSRVVHVHAPAATHWDFMGGWYGEAVDQAVVEEMVTRGLAQLTGAASPEAAWQALIPAYQPGQKVAIKVNFNNSDRDGGTCSQQGNRIDGLPQPVLALLRGLVEMRGVQPDDIWIYDASVGRGRILPDRFRQPIQEAYPSVVFWGRGRCGNVQSPPFNHADESLRVAFSHPALTDRWLTDLLHQATYLINLPILKRHGIHPVTLGFKNHFGSLDNIVRGDPDDLHLYLAPNSPAYDPRFSPLVDLYANPNIAGKTVLTVGDGLFGAPGATQPPIPWSTFNGAPNSLFFSRDPVAVDCVMCDLLRSEWRGIPEAAYDYLRLAEERGLGTFEQGDPWGGGYARIEYVRLDL